MWAVEDKRVDKAAAELYELPPEDFTRARDERAKALRKEGRRDEADAVKALRKPTVAAWALNQLARRRADDVERLLAAGEELRAAQEELLAGGDRKAFQSAAAREREQVAKLADEAAVLVADAGERASPALREKISETLHAAALDEQTAAELRAGRLVREREAIGGFGGVMAASPTPARGRGRGAKADEAAENGTEASAGGRQRPAGSATRGKAPGAAKRGAAGGGGATRRADAGARGGKAPDGRGTAREAAGARDGTASDGRAGRRDAAGAKAREDAKRRADAERREAAERRQRLAAARTDERHARRELDAAEKAIAHAGARAEAARAHAEEANARAKVTADRLKEARREQAAARKAHARAERALAEAERNA